jgi:hypothetical protein
MLANDEAIDQLHKRFEEPAQRLYSRIKASAACNTRGIRVKDIDESIKCSHLTVKTTGYNKNKFKLIRGTWFNEHLSSGFLFNFNHEQSVSFRSNPPLPRGSICVDVFTMQTQIAPLMDKKATSWKGALDKIIDKVGRPKITMIDADASIT